MIKQKSRKKFFWTVLLTIFLLSGGQISIISASTPASDLIINEFMAANGSGLSDEDGMNSDWIEIYNRSDTAINLAGWTLTDELNQPQKWLFPDMTLGSHEYLIVFASGKNRTSTEPGTALHTNFKLNKSGEFLGLYNILESNFMDTVTSQYPEQFQDVAYGRYGEELSFGYLPTPSPGEPNQEQRVQAGAVAPVTFSAERGFYEAPFTVELSTVTPEATIRYTTDGSEPTERNGTVYSEPLTVASTTLLRAVAFKSGFLTSEVNTQSYFFVDDILAQPTLSGSRLSAFQNGLDVLPAALGYKASETADNSPLRAGLTSLPAVSLVMDAQSLADLSANPDERGRDSERVASFEFIDPDGDEPGIQLDAGLRPYGQNSASDQSFRLYFRGDYGSTRLAYPLYPDSSVETFDTLVLQASGSEAYARYARYARNEWLRSSQKAMSGLGAHGRFVNLYLNGRYAGLYNLVEKPNADLMASYLGGQEEEWFVANQAGPLDDDLGRAADELIHLFTSLALAPQLGDNLTPPEYVADIYAAAAGHLDPAELIDYMLLTWYTESLDWPDPSWYAAVRVGDLPGRGRLLIGDEQVIPLQSQDDFGPVQSPQPNIHRAYFDRLMQDADFKVEFTDRLYQHLFNEGALSDADAQARWQQLNAAIEQAVVVDSRFRANEDDQPAPTRTDWLSAQEAVLAHMDGTADRLLAKARAAGYYPAFDPPLFSQQDGLVEAGFRLEMSLPANACQDCAIYYTTDGSDPRLPFTGDLIPIAEAYDSPLELTTTTQVKARLWDGQEWSALQEATFNVVEQDNKLRLTEVMYNPLEGDDYEFIELQNTGHSELDLAGISVEEGVRFTFPPDARPLAPGQVVVLVSQPEAFAERYPEVAIGGAYEGHLSNKGEMLILKDAEGQTLLEFTYDDDNGWPLSADGRGDSLTLIDAAGNPDNPKNWRASVNLYGSPGIVEPAD